MNITVGLALVIFLSTHYFGVRENGIAYFKHFLGPVWWMAPIMLPIEIISHLARPMSLSLRLFGNITGDHAVVAGFMALIPSRSFGLHGPRRLRFVHAGVHLHRALDDLHLGG